MRIDVDWLSEEKQIVHILYHANWDWQDFEEHRKKAKALSQQVSHDVVVLMEYDKDAAMLPANALRNFSIAAESADHSAKLVVIVAPSQFWRVVLVLLKRLMPSSVLKNTHVVPSRQTALSLIEQYRQNSEAYE